MAASRVTSPPTSSPWLCSRTTRPPTTRLAPSIKRFHDSILSISSKISLTFTKNQSVTLNEFPSTNPTFNRAAASMLSWRFDFLHFYPQLFPTVLSTIYGYVTCNFNTHVSKFRSNRVFFEILDLRDSKFQLSNKTQASFSFFQQAGHKTNFSSLRMQSCI